MKNELNQNATNITVPAVSDNDFKIIPPKTIETPQVDTTNPNGITADDGTVFDATGMSLDEVFYAKENSGKKINSGDLLNPNMSTIEKFFLGLVDENGNEIKDSDEEEKELNAGTTTVVPGDTKNDQADKPALSQAGGAEETPADDPGAVKATDTSTATGETPEEKETLTDSATKTVDLPEDVKSELESLRQIKSKLEDGGIDIEAIKQGKISEAINQEANSIDSFINNEISIKSKGLEEALKQRELESIRNNILSTRDSEGNLLYDQYDIDIQDSEANRLYKAMERQLTSRLPELVKSANDNIHDAIKTMNDWADKEVLTKYSNVPKSIIQYLVAEGKNVTEIEQFAKAIDSQISRKNKDLLNPVGEYKAQVDALNTKIKELQSELDKTKETSKYAREAGKSDALKALEVSQENSVPVSASRAKSINSTPKTYQEMLHDLGKSVGIY